MQNAAVAVKVLTVERIAQNRVTQGQEVDPQLVRSPSHRVQQHAGVRHRDRRSLLRRLDDLPMG